jgi:hypothetical protein
MRAVVNGGREAKDPDEIFDPGALESSSAHGERRKAMSERPSEAGLPRHECLALLATASMGRVALSIDALPVVLPVGFALLGEDVVFRPLFDAKLSVPGVDVVLAFQVDHFGAPAEAGWSVLVQGLARAVVEPEELERCRALSLPVLGVGRHSARFARLSTTRLTGRRYAAVA